MSHAVLDSFTTFGELLKHLRRRARLTQQELGLAVGYSYAHIARLENGQRTPDPGAVKAQFIDALGLQREPELATRLITLAVAAHGWAPAGEPSFSAATDGQPQPQRHNLPAPLTDLVGREQDMATTLRLLRLASVRLVALLGPPGVGKTRLAVEVARQASADFADGVCFVPLAPLADPALVTTAIAQALDLGASQADPLAGVKRHLRDKHLLLVVDNFEHVLDAAPVIAEVLAAAPRVKAITTSRAALHLSGEFVVDVPPLAAPSAVALFVVRADAIQSGFALTPENRPVVAEICRRVEGLPLAIELAAARLRLFSPRALLARLTATHGTATHGTATHGMTTQPVLDVLAEGPRDLPARQRTLRNTIAWSYDLLTPEQQRLLRTLSVFAGGCSLTAAYVVYMVAGDPTTFEADVQALLDGSLIYRSDGVDGEPRFSLLEMIREYAAEQLAACGEAEAVRQQHALYYLAWVQGSAPREMQQSGMPLRLVGDAALTPWLQRLDPEHDNLRMALVWSLREARAVDAVDAVDAGLQLVVWLFWFWYLHGPWGEARDWLERALAHTDTVSTARSQTRARVLAMLAHFAGAVGDYARAEGAAQEALTLCRALGDQIDLMNAVYTLTEVKLERNNLTEARALGEELLAITREVGDLRAVADALSTLGSIALSQKDFAQAAALLAEGLRVIKIISGNELRDEGTVRINLAALACYQGDYERALAQGCEALAAFQASGFTHGIADALLNLGDIALFQGDTPQAASQFTESLRLCHADGNQQRGNWCLAGLAAAAAMAGHASRAVTLWWAAEAVRASIGGSRPALRHDDYRARVEVAQAQLDEHARAAASAAGRGMSFEQAVEYALATMPGPA